MFRALGKSKIAFVLAILFGISLFFFKSGSRYSNLFNSDTVVAKVSGTPISTTKFNRTMQININQFNQMLGKKLDKDEIRAFQIQSLALGTLINNANNDNTPYVLTAWHCIVGETSLGEHNDFIYYFNHESS